MKDYILKHISENIDTQEKILNNDTLISSIEIVSKECIKAYKRDNKILIAGNGGSACDAQHIASELVNKFYFDRPSLCAIALTCDIATMTSISNDYGYEQLFARQLQAHGKKNDIFIAISTSGNSKNIIIALKTAKSLGLLTIGLMGEGISEMDALCDFCIKVPSLSTPRIQEAHTLIGHIICASIEKDMFAK